MEKHSDLNKDGPKLTMAELAGVDAGTAINHSQKRGKYLLADTSLEGLNKGQHDMVIGINTYLNRAFDSRDKAYFLVQGSGGVGKSYTILRAIQCIESKKVILAAPSHFAKNVLSEFVGHDYTVTTIAALLAKKVSYDAEGNQILVPIQGKIPPLLKHAVVIIDEGSMVDDKTVKEITTLATSQQIKVIVLGDFAQLPPVNQETDSIFFDSIDAELTQTMRFKGPLFNITDIIRTEIIKIRNGLPPILNILNVGVNRVSCINEEGSGYVFINRETTLIAAAVRRFKQEKGVNYVRVIAYRNSTIDKLNTRIREKLYGNNSKQFEEGEIIINNGGYTISRNSTINNGEIFKVRKSRDIVGPYEIPCKLLFLDSEEYREGVPTVSIAGKPKYDATLKRLSAKAKQGRDWRAVKAFKEKFAYFNYAYVCSTHKAQGSSIEHVFIIEEDIYAVKKTGAKEKLQSLYVAITRAAFRACIYNSNFKVDNSGLVKEYLIKDSLNV